MVRGENVRHHQESGGSPDRKQTAQPRDLGGAAHPRRPHLKTERGSRFLERAQKNLPAARGRLRIEDHRDLRDARCHLLERLQPFAGHRGLEAGKSGDVPARLRPALDETAGDRVGNQREYDRNGARRTSIVRIQDKFIRVHLQQLFLSGIDWCGSV